MLGSSCSHGEKCGGSCVHWGLLAVRLGVGVAFLAHGIQKLGNMDMVVDFFGKLGMPAVLAWFVALVETLAGAALILGVFTGIAGGLLAIIMVVAVFTAKRAAPFIGGWELDFVLFFSALAAALLGPGKFSAWCLMGKGKGCAACGKDGCACGKK